MAFSHGFLIKKTGDIEMKSNDEALKYLGLLDKTIISSEAGTQAFFSYLHSSNAQERTAAAYYLGLQLLENESEVAPHLLAALKKEKALYTKIQLCNALEKGMNTTFEVILPALGHIGNNQHKILPTAVSKKKSYPLPRDIIARTIGNMTIHCLETALNALSVLTLTETRELIDGIGFLCFYNKITNEEKVYEKLINHYENHYEDTLTRWKITQALSAFKTTKAIKKLQTISNYETEPLIKNEALRSLNIIADK